MDSTLANIFDFLAYSVEILVLLEFKIVTADLLTMKPK